jgi:hypothetical protein
VYWRFCRIDAAKVPDAKTMGPATAPEKGSPRLTPISLSRRSPRPE